MTWFFAFLHHVAAFTLVAALVVEFVLIRDQLTVARARTIQLADMAFGIAARGPEGHLWNFGTYDPWVQNHS